ncbi:MAG: S8 family peptidase, partial [Bacteroidales bacterium]
LTLHCTSRWMNTALFKSADPVDITTLNNLPYVKNVKLVKDPAAKSEFADKLAFATYQASLPPFDNPLSMINGLPVHNSGFTGRGILIAVLDAGFLNAENISSLNNLRSRNGIAATRDFVDRGSFVYDYNNHGTAVLSVIAGDIEGSITGSAPNADFILIRTEDVFSEFPAEEDYWAAGAEFADSAGCDILSSSLGYFNFDDPSMNYKYADMNGRTAFVTLAAEAAASRGILVVNSAGNEREQPWLHIIAPSDGDSVLAVGAVDGNRLIASFSSAGPSYDRRVKPDVAAQGVSVPVQVSTLVVERAAGTSFSCPVISGMSACLLQAVLQAKSSDIISAVRAASDRYKSPDSLYGYGIPDMVKAVAELQSICVAEPAGGSVIWPNPFSSVVNVTFTENPQWLRVEIFDETGRLMGKKYLKDYISRSVVLDDLQHFRQGVYFIRLTTSSGTFTHKAIKTR